MSAILSLLMCVPRWPRNWPRRLFRSFMSLKVNLRHLDDHGQHLTGELPAAELDLDIHDEMIKAERPLGYDLAIEKLEQGLLVTGSLRLVLSCQCVRCLKAFQHKLELKRWTCHVPLEGEEQAPIVN